MLRQIQNTIHDVRLYFIAEGLNLLDIDADMVSMSAQHDIVILSIAFTAGANTKHGLISFADTSMQDMIFSTLDDLFVYLNTTFKTTHSLYGEFNLAAGNYINYRNVESWGNASIQPDRGVFDPVFDNVFN